MMASQGLTSKVDNMTPKIDNVHRPSGSEGSAIADKGGLV